MFQIDKNVPIPPLPKARKYHWWEMTVGDSFFVPDMTIKEFGRNIHLAQRVTGHRFTARTIDGGVRVWRVE